MIGLGGVLEMDNMVFCFFFCFVISFLEVASLQTSLSAGVKDMAMVAAREISRAIS